MPANFAVAARGLVGANTAEGQRHFIVACARVIIVGHVHHSEIQAPCILLRGILNINMLFPTLSQALPQGEVSVVSPTKATRAPIGASPPDEGRQRAGI